MRRRKIWAGFVDSLLHHRYLIFTPLAIIAIAGAILLGLVISRDHPRVSSAIVINYLATIPEPEPTRYYSPLTGSEVKTEAITKNAVTAVMIENSPDARPQSGLKDAGVVFEARAEGGITRFMALYQESKPQLIGPVRSVRSVFVDWLKPFDASIAHVGGNSRALAVVRDGTYRDIDQFFNAAYYWRATDRYAPHNVYTSFAKLDDLNLSKGYTTSKPASFARVDGEPATSPNAKNISITISSALYNSSYSYDSKTNTYKRSQGGEAHLDREKGQIAPSVIVALKVNEQTVLEDGYREKIDVIGSGSGYIFQNGTVTAITWKKSSRDGQISFTDKDKKDVALVRGQTWIVGVPNGVGDISWK